MKLKCKGLTALALTPSKGEPAPSKAETTSLLNSAARGAPAVLEPLAVPAVAELAMRSRASVAASDRRDLLLLLLLLLSEAQRLSTDALEADTEAEAEAEEEAAHGRRDSSSRDLAGAGAGTKPHALTASPALATLESARLLLCDELEFEAELEEATEAA